MKKLNLILGAAVLAATFTSCKDENEKMAEETFDRYERYVDSVNNVAEAEALANWEAIEASYNERTLEAEAAVANMKDQEAAQDRLEKTKTKYTEYKVKVEASAPPVVVVDRKETLRASFFGSGKIGQDMNFDWVNKDNILKVYNDFYNEFDKNKDSYSREDMDEIKALYEALDAHKNTVEKEGLSSQDNRKIAELKFKFGPKLKWERAGAKAEENQDAKE